MNLYYFVALLQWSQLTLFWCSVNAAAQISSLHYACPEDSPSVPLLAAAVLSSCWSSALSDFLGTCCFLRPMVSRFAEGREHCPACALPSVVTSVRYCSTSTAPTGSAAADWLTDSWWSGVCPVAHSRTAPPARHSTQSQSPATNTTTPGPRPYFS